MQNVVKGIVLLRF